MPIRFPKYCTRCSQSGHYAEDCKRMPAGMGMCQEERDMMRKVAYDRSAILWAAAAVVVALMIEGAARVVV